MQARAHRTQESNSEREIRQEAMAPINPKNICEICGEFLPHACAAIVTWTRRQGSYRKFIVIEDREPKQGEQK
jgi:hypothetical protein